MAGKLYHRATEGGGFTAMTLSLKLLGSASSADMLQVAKGVMLDATCAIAAAFDLSAGQLQPLQFAELLSFLRVLMQGTRALPSSQVGS